MKNITIEEYSKIGPQYYSDEFSDLLRTYLNSFKSGSILDCGCGDGNLLSLLNSSGYFKDKKTYAVDLSENRINLVRKINKNIICNVDDAEELKTIQDNSIDFFMSTQVIEHVDDKKMIGAIDRKVKKGGTVYLATVFKKSYGWYFHRNNGHWVLDPTHLREYQKDNELFDLIENDKFEILENKKHQQYYPLLDFFIKRLRINNRKIYGNSFLNFLRKIKVPIAGYYKWEIIIRKK